MCSAGQDNRQQGSDIHALNQTIQNNNSRVQPVGFDTDDRMATAHSCWRSQRALQACLACCKFVRLGLRLPVNGAFGSHPPCRMHALVDTSLNAGGDDHG